MPKTFQTSSNAERHHEIFYETSFRFCTKLEKVSWKRVFPCIQEKDFFSCRKFFMVFFSAFELIWKLFDIYRIFLKGLRENSFFLECIGYALTYHASSIDTSNRCIPNLKMYSSFSGTWKPISTCVKTKEKVYPNT